MPGGAVRLVGHLHERASNPTAAFASKSIAALIRNTPTMQLPTIREPYPSEDLLVGEAADLAQVGLDARVLQHLGGCPESRLPGCRSLGVNFGYATTLASSADLTNATCAFLCSPMDDLCSPVDEQW